MATQVQQVQSRSLWGRLAGRAARKARPARPIAAAPTHRPLTVKDALYTVDAQTDKRVYTPLILAGQREGLRPGEQRLFAGREWQHCGEQDGLLFTAWRERNEPGALLWWLPLDGDNVLVVEGGTVG